VTRQPNTNNLSRLDKRRKGIYILPNLFTTAGLFAGFFAIVQAAVGHFDYAAVAIFVAMAMDTLDGRVARITSTASDFGKEYDSLADVIAFGLAPALVIYEWGLNAVGRPGWLIAFIFVAAAALRLARFNVQQTHDSRYFQGLPCPMAAGVVAAAIWVADTHAMQGDWANVVGMLGMLMLALAMVSTLPYRSFKDLDVRDRVPFTGLLLVVFVFVLISFDPPWVMFLITGIYFLSGPFLWLFPRVRNREERRRYLDEEAQNESRSRRA
jgi:CDP-diacylglycerol--serine O-phosphatidyltransferase